MRSLESTIAIEMMPFHLVRVNLIDNEDFTGVLKKVRCDMQKIGADPSPQFLEEGILALKQYYVIALFDPCNRHAVSDVVDQFWHAHILHTREYVAFCDKIFGQYVTHEPLDHDDQAAIKEVAILYAYTSYLYRKLFSYVNVDFFPVTMPDSRLLCTHTEIGTSAVREMALVG